MGPVSKQRLKEVVPVLAENIEKLEVEMGQELGVTQALRTSSEQYALWAQGRSDLETVNELRAAVGWAALTEEQYVVVTEAKPGESYHEFGMAVDVVPLTSAGEADWNVNHPVWQKLVQLAERLGMTSGILWADEPHLQMSGKWPVGKPLAIAATLRQQGGLWAVWEAAGLTEPVVPATVGARGVGQ